MDYDQFEVHENECGTCKECHKFGIIKAEMLSHHIDECTEYPYNCFFCGYEGNRVELTKKHRCYQMNCGTKKDGGDFYFTKARIANFKSLANIFPQIQCAVCKNLLRQPKQCAEAKCDSLMCSKCLDESLKRNGNQCPCCQTKNPKIEEINRILKNQLIKAQIYCISCKNQFSYEQIDEHEVHCGKCTLCVTKLSPALSIVQHHLNDCQKIELRCVQCMKSFKRSKFKTHKCEKVLTEEEIRLLKEAMQESRQDKLDMSPLLGAMARAQTINDEPLDKIDYETFWKKKTKSMYFCGLGRWFKICNQNLSKDEEHKAKLF